MQRGIVWTQFAYNHRQAVTNAPITTLEIAAAEANDTAPHFSDRLRAVAERLAQHYATLDDIELNYALWF